MRRRSERRLLSSADLELLVAAEKKTVQQITESGGIKETVEAWGWPWTVKRVLNENHRQDLHFPARRTGYITTDLKVAREPHSENKKNEGAHPRHF